MTSTIVTQKNIAQLGALRRLSAPSAATAGGAGDAATTTGVTVDRFGFGTGSMPMSAVFGVAYEAVLATAKTLAFGYAVQDSADGATWADYQTATYTAVATGTTGGSAVAGTFEAAVDLSSARRFVRFNHNLDLSATQTDTAVARAVGFFAGFDRLPA